MRHLLQKHNHQGIYSTKNQGDTVEITLKFSTDGAKIGKKFSGVKGVVSVVTPRDQVCAEQSETASPDNECLLYIYTGLNMLYLTKY